MNLQDTLLKELNQSRKYKSWAESQLYFALHLHEFKASVRVLASKMDTSLQFDMGRLHEAETPEQAYEMLKKLLLK